MFRPLAKRFGPDQPFLGVRVEASDWTHLPAPFRFEDIADVFIQKIRAYQPEGPYYLGGFCLTGLVAYEVARQLIASGQEVKLLVLFYSQNPAFFARSTRRAELRLQYELTKFHMARLARLRRREFVNYAKERFEGAVSKLRSAKGATDLKRQFLPELEEIGAAAARDYHPGQSAVRTVLFRPAEDPQGRYWDIQYNWKRYVTAPLDVHFIPGDHSSMFREPYVEVLAKQMMRYLDDELVTA